jgi:hypothetical protein
MLVMDRKLERCEAGERMSLDETVVIEFEFEFFE